MKLVTLQKPSLEKLAKVLVRFKVQGQKKKVKGVAKRSVDALGNAFQQGKQQTQKAVAGQDYKAPQPKAQAQGTTTSTTKQNSQVQSQLELAK